MGKIIESDNLDKHNIKKFHFASLGVGDEKKSSYDPSLFSDNELIKESTPAEENEPQERHNSVADELLQKIEALTNDNITLTQELETLKKEYQQKLETESEEAFKKGKEEGIKETQNTLQEHNDELNMQLVKSITLLDEAIQQQHTFFEKTKEELVDSAIIIAKKVIKKEIEENAHTIALNLAENFLSDLKEATQITLKVNPQDATYIQEHYKDEKNIKIDPDDAINKGGIIILSDIGNIDGNIDTRLQKAIALIEREG